MMAEPTMTRFADLRSQVVIKRAPDEALPCECESPHDRLGINIPGRKDQLQASGELDRLVESLGRHCERNLILNDIDTGVLSAVRIGEPRCSAVCGSGWGSQRFWAIF